MYFAWFIISVFSGAQSFVYTWEHEYVQALYILERLFLIFMAGSRVSGRYIAACMPIAGRIARPFGTREEQHIWTSRKDKDSMYEYIGSYVRLLLCTIVLYISRIYVDWVRYTTEETAVAAAVFDDDDKGRDMVFVHSAAGI